MEQGVKGACCPTQEGSREKALLPQGSEYGKPTTRKTSNKKDGLEICTVDFLTGKYEFRSLRNQSSRIRFVQEVESNQGKAGQAKERQSKPKQGKAKAWQRKAKQTKAKQGQARQDKAKQGKARQGQAKHSQTRQSKTKVKPCQRDAAQGKRYNNTLCPSRRQNPNDQST